jgi:hypothetical protein
VAHLKGSALWIFEMDTVWCVLHHMFDIYIYIYAKEYIMCVCVFLSDVASDVVCYRVNVIVICCNDSVVCCIILLRKSCPFLPCF